MSASLAIYLIGISNGVSVALVLLTAAMLGLVIFFVICLCTANDDYEFACRWSESLSTREAAKARINKYQRALFKTGSLAALFMFLTAAIPSKTTLAAMYLVPTLAENPKVSAIGGKSLDAMIGLLDHWIIELRHQTRLDEAKERYQKDTGGEP